MLAELGLILLIIAFLCAILQASQLLKPINIQRYNPQISCRLALAQLMFTALAFLVLISLFLNNDFSVAYVAEHSNTNLPMYYQVSAVWGGHEGSLLLWILLLSSWSYYGLKQASKFDSKVHKTTAITLGLIAAGFFGFIILTSNPFARILPFAPNDGVDLNPLLQDFGLIVHPPILYMGYVGSAVPFAFAIAMLLHANTANILIKLLRKLVIISWAFLSLGITLGSWWAYYELGWGGWWFWDPVENASLMPWLAETALLHVLIISDKQKSNYKFALLLVMCAFGLSLLGTFLVRSGILTSVHAFATDPKRGLYILSYLAVITGAGLFVYLKYSDNLEQGSMANLPARAVFLLMSALLITVMCTTVVLGTFYPIIIDVLALGKISIGAPYFNTVIPPLMFISMALMALVMSVNWGRFKKKTFMLNNLWLLIFAVVILVLLNSSTVLKITTVGQYVGLMLSILLITALFYDFLNKLCKSYRTAINCNYLTMFCAHLGIAMSAFAISITAYNSVENDVRMQITESFVINNYKIELDRVNSLKGPNYNSKQAEFKLYQDGKYLTTLKPEQRLYQPSNMPIAETAIDIGIWRDIYIALGEELDGAWSVRIYYKPMIRYLWLGGVLMFTAGMLSIASRSRRKLA